MSREAERVVARWYPASWRDRYGEEIVALLDDTYGDQRVPRGARWALARQGTTERLRASGLAGRSVARETRLRAGAVSVLAAGTLYVVAGSIFAKFIEHWDAATPVRLRALPAAAVTGAQVGAALGAAAALVAVVVSWRALGRHVSERGVREVVATVTPAIVAGLVALASSLAMVLWAHRLSDAQRNLTDARYQWAFVAWCAVLVACLVAAVFSGARLARRLEYRALERRRVTQLVVVTTVAMLVVLASTLAWWVQMARHARGFWDLGAARGWTSAYPLPLVVSVTMMGLGAIVALYGATRTVQAWRESPRGA